MKRIIIFILIAIPILTVISCSKDKDNIEKIDLLSLKEKFVGKWLGVSPYNSCNILTFSDNDTLYYKEVNNGVNTIYHLRYQIIDNNSIQVTRLWGVEQEKKTTRHNIVFLTNDTIIIEQFINIEHELMDFENMKLIKIDNVLNAPCPCNENKNLAKLKFPNGEAYLFKDSISIQKEQQLFKQADSENGVKWIVFDSKTKEASLYIANGSILNICEICNFPDFVKTWNIPHDGQTVYFEGITYESCAPKGGVANVSYFDYILTTLIVI